MSKGLKLKQEINSGIESKKENNNSSKTVSDITTLKSKIEREKLKHGIELSENLNSIYEQIIAEAIDKGFIKIDEVA